jgi:outer membrane protein TolC
MAPAQELPLDVYLQKVLQAGYERVDFGLRSDEIAIQRSQLTAEYLPSLTYSLNSTQSEQGPRDVFVGSLPFHQPATSYEYHSTSLNLSQQVFDWGNSFRKKKKFNLEKAELKADYRQQARGIAEQAISLYYQLSEATAVYELLKQELSDTQKQQMHLNDLVDRGVKPPQDKLRIDITINEILSRISSQKMTIAKLRAEVSFLMNEPLDTAVTLIFPRYEVQAFEIDSSPQSPAMQYLNRQLLVREAELSILKWDRLPDLYLNAGYSRGNEMFKSLYTNLNQDWNTYISFSLSFPLYRNNQQTLQEARKRIEIQRLTRKLEDEQKKFDKQNTILIEQIRALQKQIELQEANIKSYESIYAHERERYNSGLIEYRILKEAKNNLLQSRQSLISLKHRLLEYQEKLNLNSGLWDRVIDSTMPE